MKKVGIAIPAANEEQSIQGFLDDLVREIAGLAYMFTVYIVMDKFSQDNTFHIVTSNARRDGRIRAVFFEESSGVVSCYLKGFKCALEDDCDYVIEMDSGGSHPPSKIKDILHALDEEGYDVVFMSRFMKGGGLENVPWRRRVISKGGTALALLWLGMHLSDGTSGFEAFRASVLRSFNLDAFISTGGIYQTEMKYYCCSGSYRIKEIPFKYVGSATTFKFKWLLTALQALLRMRHNREKVLR